MTAAPPQRVAVIGGGTMGTGIASVFAPPQLLVDKVAAGEQGRKSGGGFYDRGDARRA